MFKHLRDDGDLNLFISDSGEMCLVCSKCKNVWLLESTPFGPAQPIASAPPQKPGRASRDTTSISTQKASRGAIPIGTKKVSKAKRLAGLRLATSMEHHSDILASGGLDTKTIVARLMANTPEAPRTRLAKGTTSKITQDKAKTRGAVTATARAKPTDKRSSGGANNASKGNTGPSKAG